MTFAGFFMVSVPEDMPLGGGASFIWGGWSSSHVFSSKSEELFSFTPGVVKLLTLSLIRFPPTTAYNTNLYVVPGSRV